MTRLALLLVLLPACYSGTLDVYSAQPWTDAQRDALDVTSALIGREIMIVDREYGAVWIKWRDAPWVHPKLGRISGAASEHQIGCKRHLHSIADGYVIAHEMGHTFGLEHSDDTADIMHESCRGEFFGEFETLDRRLDRFDLCVP